MPVGSICIEGTGLVTSVGYNAAASCAAIRSKLSNPTETRIANLQGDWTLAHQVDLAPLRGVRKLTRMAAMAVQQCLEAVPSAEWGDIPTILCVSEPSRPNRSARVDQLLQGVADYLEISFASAGVVAKGRVGVAVALAEARRALLEGDAPRVLVVAVDSLVDAKTLAFYEEQRRLLTEENSNGFMAGEAAGAVLLTRRPTRPSLHLLGLGFGVEPATIDSESPLRADGLTGAIQRALQEAEIDFINLDFRITDLSGEHYYFKEASLAIGRVLRNIKDEFDIWHPAESVGETGSAIGAVILALADAACRNAFAPGPRILVHLGNDGGERSAAILEFKAG